MASNDEAEHLEKIKFVRVYISIHIHREREHAKLAHKEVDNYLNSLGAM